MSRIVLIIADIHKYLKDLKMLKVRRMADLNDKKNFYSASMVLLTIFTRAIDLGKR